MRRTILLADDSPTIQRLVKHTFADADFEILSVSNGEAAIRKFEEAGPDVVLADIYMPGKNGYEVCAYVKAHGSRSSTPVILLVGAFDAFDEDAAVRVGAAANITKPFEPRALVDLVISVLSENENRKTAPEPAPVAVGREDSREDGRKDPGEDLQPGSAASLAPALETELASAVEPALEPALEPNDDDLLGLEVLFKETPPEPQRGQTLVTEADVERIVDRVVRKLSSEVIESIAWEIVPDITEKVLREELKRNS